MDFGIPFNSSIQFALLGFVNLCVYSTKCLTVCVGWQLNVQPLYNHSDMIVYVVLVL